MTSTARDRLLGLSALLALLLIVAGLPALLLATGNPPLPGGLPTLRGVVAALTRPDDGTLLLAFIRLLAWGGWAFIAGSLALECVARVRRVPTPHLRGLQGPQSLARILIGTVLLLTAATPLAATLEPAAAAVVAAPAVPGDTGTGSATTTQSATSMSAASRTTLASSSGEVGASAPKAGASAARSASRADAIAHTVRRGESLWSIARDHLGAGHRFREIADLNRDVLGDHAGFLTPGWVLRLPPDASVGVPEGNEKYVVRQGDTLSEIAEEQLGTASAYPKIFTASRGIAQPGGHHLSDPDVIDVGWTLAIPNGTHTNGHGAQHETPRDREQTHHPATPPVDASHPSGPITPSIPPSPALSQSPGSASPAPTEVGSASSSALATEDDAAPGWATSVFAGAGTLLAGSILLSLRLRRQGQHRARRPGRTITVPPITVTPTETAIRAHGPAGIPTVQRVDALLKALAASQTAAHAPMPRLIAVELTDTHIVLHLAEAAELPSPWAEDGQSTRSYANDEPIGPIPQDQPAPYPLLVTLGTRRPDGSVWLLNLEDPGVATITGDERRIDDFVRHMLADLAVHPWAAVVCVHSMGGGQDASRMDPVRIRPTTSVQSSGPEDMDVARPLLTEAVEMLAAATAAAVDVPTARAAMIGPELWLANLLITPSQGSEVGALAQSVGQLLELVVDHPRLTGSALVRIGDVRASGLLLRIDPDGRCHLEGPDVDIDVVGLSAEDAQGCGTLLVVADDVATDAPVPHHPAGSKGWRAYADCAGALTTEHTLLRRGDDVDDAASVLPLADATYLKVAATTVEDLQAVAPKVTAATAAAVQDADPNLDADVEMWFSDDCPLPRLTLLGPVRVRARGSVRAAARRNPYYTELLAYLATRSNGASISDVSQAMGGLTDQRVRTDVSTVRQWLGVNPRTGILHVPKAPESSTAGGRGAPSYQVDDLLIDAELFFRLRARGQARGPDGLDDLRRALSLVSGEPFTRLRKETWPWLAEDRLDQHVIVAIVDTAHAVTTHDLAEGDLDDARLATQIALIAAPYEEIPRLDLVAIESADGNQAEADRILRDEIDNRSDDDGPPTEVPQRTGQIVRRRHARAKSQFRAS